MSLAAVRLEMNFVPEIDLAVDMDGEQLELFPLPTVAVEQSVAAATAAARALWQKATGTLQLWFGATVWQNWLSQLVPTGLTPDTFIAAAPTKLVLDWTRTHYLDDMLRQLKNLMPGLQAIDLQLNPALCDMAPVVAELPLPVAPAAVTVIDYGAPIEPRSTFDAFVVDKSNQLAFEAARRVAGSQQMEFNPLFLHGGVGLGKTHLMHAIANDIRARYPERRVVYLSAEQFMYQFIRALRDKDTVSFKELFRTVDVLMIDDVQFISGKESTQEEFFHTFNALIEQNKQIILSADKSPGDLTGVGARLTSRMAMGLVVDIHPTSYELRLGILHAKAEAKKAAVPSEVLGWLAEQITGNVRELEGALNRLLAHASLNGAAITLEYAKTCLADQLRTSVRRLTLDEIQNKVAQHFNLRVLDLHSARRARAVARPRQVAMYLAKHLTTRSLPEIGRSFGGRDHTTVMHAVRTIENLMQADRQLADDVAALRRLLSQ